MPARVDGVLWLPVIGDDPGVAEADESKTAKGGLRAWSERQGKIVGGIEILSGRVRRALDRNIQPGETVHFCLKGDFDHSLIALEDRLLVVKAGVWAGTTFGARVATIYYKDVTGIEVNTGLLNCVVEVSTASYPAVGKKSVWLKGQTGTFNRDPDTESNCVPVMRHNLKKWKPHLDELRELITRAKGAPVALGVAEHSQGSSLSAQLKELAELHGSGALDDEEFAQAKARLLAG
jgi:hypothetical protein